MIRGNILIVDDEHDICSNLQEGLTRKGYQVVTARSGQKAYNLLDERKTKYGTTHVGMIVSDWMMADGDGLKLLATVKTKFQEEDIPFILMSGAVSLQQLNDIIKIGADGVMLKPFQISALVKKMEDVAAFKAQKRLQKSFNK